jgi:hypothetical protein
MRITGVTEWKRWRYNFDFKNKVYTMDDKELHITPAEECYLYERLVLYRQPQFTTCRYAIQQLRKRYGSDFLAECIKNSQTYGEEGRIRREAFERILWEYIKKDGRAGYQERGYEFDFLNGRYTWYGEVLRITPREAVFLYERLVLRLRNKRKAHRYAEGYILAAMRNKFGLSFLQDVLKKRRF